MATQNVQKYGISTWDEKVGPGKKQDQNLPKQEWMRLVDGTHTIRVVTEPYQYLSHKYKEEGDSGFGEKIRCSGPGRDDKFCPVCALESKAKRRWLVGVIDRSNNTYKVLDFSVAVYTALKNFKNNRKYGLPTKYDIDINVDSQAGAMGFYTVMASPPEPMSEADIKLAQSANLDYLMRMCTPPTPEVVLGKLNKTREKLHKSQYTMEELQTAWAAIVAARAEAAAKRAANGNGAASAVVPTPAVDMSSDDEDLTFPPADGPAAE